MSRIFDVIPADPDETYRYPDAFNAMEAQVIPQARRNEEQALWSVMMPARVDGPGLDAGCGLGAFTGLLASRSTEVLAIDADARRLAHARSIHGDLAAWRVLKLEDPILSSEKLRGAFKAISCIQVLGHVPRAAAMTIVRTFHHLLSTDGVLVLAVPFVNHFAEEYRLVRATDATLQGHPITPELYDRLAQSPEEATLHVRHFTAASFRKLVEEAGFSVDEMQPYNWYNERRADMMLRARPVTRP